jgi:hypothetical protein
MNSTNESAIKLALELLKSAHVSTDLVWKRHDCVQALEEALASEQEQRSVRALADSEQLGEPVARVTKHVIPLREEIMLYCDKHLEIGTPLYLHSQRNGDSPCARHCEANAFEIEIKNLKGDIERAILAEREACLKICEEQAVTAYWEGADVCVEEIKKRNFKA